MIDWEKSAELNNCTVEWLKARFERFPKSNKKVVRVCDSCGEKGNVLFGGHSNFCHPCSMQISEVREAARLKSLDRFSNQEARDVASKSQTKRFSNPKERDKMSVSKKQYFIDNPDAADEHSKRMLQYYIDHPEIVEYHSYAIKNSKSAKASQDRQRGGNDIVMHHYLYDDADLSKYTMPMTRSEHGKMHRRMQLDDYTVPHINSVTDDNGLWGYKSW